MSSKFEIMFFSLPFYLLCELSNGPDLVARFIIVFDINIWVGKFVTLVFLKGFGNYFAHPKGILCSFFTCRHGLKIFRELSKLVLVLFVGKYFM